MANGSYLLNTQAREALAALPRNAGPVEIEGFGQGPAAPMEEPLVYNLVDEKTDGNMSLPTDRDDNAGLAYLGGTEPLGPAFKPDYRYVLTRMAGISTDRRVLARHGTIALEERTEPLDVTINGGVSVAAAWEDPTGTAWFNPNRPLHFVILGFPGQPGLGLGSAEVHGPGQAGQASRRFGVQQPRNHANLRVGLRRATGPGDRIPGGVRAPARPAGEAPLLRPTTTAGGAPGEHERFVSSLLGRSLSAGRPGTRRPARR